MVTTNGRSAEALRQEIEREREGLAEAVDALRSAADVTAGLRSRLPLVAAAALGAGFVLAGGIGATMRFLARKGRER